MSEAGGPASFRERATRCTGRAVLLYVGWLVLSEARADLLLPGLPAAVLAALASDFLWRIPRPTIDFGACLAYVPHFLWRSLEGGLDVARRVLLPSLPISPTFLSYRFGTDHKPVRVLLCNAVSLMPGTLGVRLEGREALLHLLSKDAASQETLKAEERRLDRLFRHRGAPRE